MKKEDYTTKCTAIGHAIIAAGRPRSFKSLILLSTSVYLHRQFLTKDAVNLFARLGFSASYDEARTFELSTIVESRDRILDHSFSQYVFDNADFNSITLDGHNTMHVMGGIQIVSPSDAVLPSPPIQRLKEKPSAEEIAALTAVPIERTVQVSKSSDQQTIFRNVDSLILYVEPIGENLSPYDAAWLFGKLYGVQISGWNGFMEKVTSGMPPFKKSAVLFLPFIDLPAHNKDCIKTALSLAIEKSREVDQKITFVTFDYRYI